MVKLTLNGRAVEAEDDPAMPLLWFIRDRLKLTGTKFGCGAGLCGACTVILGGRAVRSCITPLGEAQGREVTTIEGLAPEGAPCAVQAAWVEEQVPQCGYCQSGMIMAAAALLRTTPLPNDAEIAEAITNVCRCGTYPRVKRAIARAAGRSKTGQSGEGQHHG